MSPTDDLLNHLNNLYAMSSGATPPTADQWREIQAKANECVVAPYGRDSVTKEPLPYPGFGGYYPEGYTRTPLPQYESVAGSVSGRLIPLRSSEQPYYEIIHTGISDYRGPLAGIGNMNAFTHFNFAFT